MIVGFMGALKVGTSVTDGWVLLEFATNIINLFVAPSMLQKIILKTNEFNAVI